MAAVISGGVFNVFGDWFFVFPLGLGMFGAALATLMGTIIQSVVLASHLFSKNNQLRFQKPAAVVKSAKEILSVGVGASLVDLANAILFTLMNNQINRYSSVDAMSVFGVIVNVDTLLQSLFAGVGQAIQPIIAVNYGAGQKKRCISVMSLALGTTGVMGLVFTLVCVIFPKQITALFMDATPDVLSIAPGIMRQFFLMMLFMGINIVAIYYLQSILLSQKALVIALGRGLIISGFMAIVLPYLIGENGLWLSLPIAEAVVCAISAAMLLSQRKEASKSA